MYNDSSILSTPDCLAALTSLLSIFLGLKTHGKYRQYGQLAFIQPPVITSLTHFLPAYVIPNAVYVFSSNWHHMSGHLGSSANTFAWLNYATLAVTLAAVGMWVGYEGRFANNIAIAFRSNLRGMPFLASNISVGLLPVFVLLACGFMAPFIRIKLGIFGFFYNEQTVVESILWRQWISLLDDAGFLGLLLLSFAAFGYRGADRTSARVMLGIAIVFLVTMGLASGVKSSMVIPFIIAGIGCYIQTRRIPVKLIAIATIMVVVSYPFVTPLRRRCLSDRDIDIHSVSAVFSTVMSSVSDTIQGESIEGDQFSWSEFADRNNLIVFTAISLNYGDHGMSDSDRAMIRKPLLLFPFTAFVPRAFWKDKPLNNTATWYNVRVLGAPEKSNTAVGMGPVSYLYFAGGFPVVFLGFWLLGVMQKVIFWSFANGSLGCWVIYFGMLGPITSVNSDFGALLAGITRLLPCLLLMQYLIVRSLSGNHSRVVVRKYQKLI